jgi:hypothetical protein
MMGGVLDHSPRPLFFLPSAVIFPDIRTLQAVFVFINDRYISFRLTATKAKIANNREIHRCTQYFDNTYGEDSTKGRLYIELRKHGVEGHL